MKCEKYWQAFQTKRKKKLGGKGKWGPGEINICEVYSRKGKAIGSKEIPEGNFLQRQQIRNRMGLNRKLIFPAGAFPANLRSIGEWQTNAKQMRNQEIIIEFTVTGKIWGWEWEERKRVRDQGKQRRGERMKHNRMCWHSELGEFWNQTRITYLLVNADSQVRRKV